MADRLPTVASGARTTVAGIASTRLVVDMGDLYKLETEEGALMTTMGILGMERAKNKTVQWHTSELRPKFIRVNGGTLTDSTTTITVDTPGGNYVLPGFQIKNTRTKETMIATTGGSATTVVVTARSWGATAAAALLDNDEFMILGPAYAENASLQSAQSVTETLYSNYLQTLRHNWSIGGLAQNLAEHGGNYGGKDPDVQRQDMFLTHKRDCNLTLLHSEGAVSGGTATMQGIIPWIETNAPNNVLTTSTLTEANLQGLMRTWFRYGRSRNRALLVSQRIGDIISEFAGSAQRVEPGEDTYGLDIRTYQSKSGKVKVIVEYGLEGDKHAGTAVGLDLGTGGKGLKLKHARNTQLIKNRQGTSVDGYEEEVLTDLSGVYGIPEGFCLLEDVAA